MPLPPLSSTQGAFLSSPGAPKPAGSLQEVARWASTPPAPSTGRHAAGGEGGGASLPLSRAAAELKTSSPSIRTKVLVRSGPSRVISAECG